MHFKSVANQVRFVMLRNQEKPTEGASRRTLLRNVIINEISLARRLFTLARADSRLGYEATNHYVYLPRDLIEKEKQRDPFVLTMAGIEAIS